MGRLTVDSFLDEVGSTGLIVIVRSKREVDLSPVVEGLWEAGVRHLEITMNTPNALRTLESLRSTAPAGLVLGAGTVLNEGDARAALAAGAQFLVTPGFVEGLVELAREVPVVMGAMTPTEIHRAHRSGAALVKVFPAGILGPGYVRAVLAPLPFVRLVPTGGVGPENAAAFITAGAFAVGVGSALFAEAGPGETAARARRLVNAIRSAKEADS